MINGNHPFRSAIGKSCGHRRVYIIIIISIVRCLIGRSMKTSPGRQRLQRQLRHGLRTSNHMYSLCGIFIPLVDCYEIRSAEIPRPDTYSNENEGIRGVHSNKRPNVLIVFPSQPVSNRSAVPRIEHKLPVGYTKRAKEFLLFHASQRPEPSLVADSQWAKSGFEDAYRDDLHRLSPQVKLKAFVPRLSEWLR